MSEMRELTETELQDVSGGGLWSQALVAALGGFIIGGVPGALLAAGASLLLDEGSAH